MKRSLVHAFLIATVLLPASLWAQGGYGGRGSTLGPANRYGPGAPKLPGVELTGPLDTALAPALLNLSGDQAARYTQAYDSFMVATRPQRDSAGVAIAKMNQRLDDGDRAAALFYAERVQELGKYLRDRQDRFESDLRHILNGDQIKAYKKWREGEDQAVDRKRREEELRWQEAGFRGEFGGPRVAGTPEKKTSLPTVAGGAAPAIGAQAVRVSPALDVPGHPGVDRTGALAGPHLRAQAERAFANLGAVLQASGASPRDVTVLTIYVVHYRLPGPAAHRRAGPGLRGAHTPDVAGVGGPAPRGAGGPVS